MAQSTEQSGHTVQGHIPAVASALLAVLVELVRVTQQRGARSGRDENGQTGSKFSVSCRLVHDRVTRLSEKL